MYPSNWIFMKHATSINPHVPSSMFLVLKPCLFDCSDIFRSSIWFTCGKITHVGIGRVAAGFQQSFSIPTLGVAHSSNRMDWTLDARQPMKAACVLWTLIVMEIPQGLAPVLWHIDNFTSQHFPSTESCSVARIELQQPSAPRFTNFFTNKASKRGSEAKSAMCEGWKVRQVKSWSNLHVGKSRDVFGSGMRTLRCHYRWENHFQIRKVTWNQSCNATCWKSWPRNWSGKFETLQGSEYVLLCHMKVC